MNSSDHTSPTPYTLDPILSRGPLRGMHFYTAPLGGCPQGPSANKSPSSHTTSCEECPRLLEDVYLLTLNWPGRPKTAGLQGNILKLGKRTYKPRGTME